MNMKQNGTDEKTIGKIDQLLCKFKAFKDRVRNESEMLEQDVQKYIH